ncbi:hypothetical protein L2E82_49183 [Cichorium intybus]|uniref:Uncharacterized protein n=1 Tax=Cichorium intybus TaxID=13427 RepID=A0ACB8Z405_CICIN|nr:hypothetical protein L2E82_49183 [Cichorium intybus]
MDSDSWTRLSTSNSSSRRYQSRSESFHLVEEFEGDEEPRPEFLCPFCAEDFDIVGLCCHIDEEHTLEAKNGVSYARFRRGGNNSTLSILKKGNIHSLLGASSLLVQSSSEPDQLLSSFISNSPPTTQSPSATSSMSISQEANNHLSQRSNKQWAPLSDKDQEEKARRSEFVQGLLFSTFLDDGL